MGDWGLGIGDWRLEIGDWGFGQAGLYARSSSLDMSPVAAGITSRACESRRNERRDTTIGTGDVESLGAALLMNGGELR